MNACEPTVISHLPSEFPVMNLGTVLILSCGERHLAGPAETSTGSTLWEICYLLWGWRKLALGCCTRARVFMLFWPPLTVPGRLEHSIPLLPGPAFSVLQWEPYVFLILVVAEW